MHSKSIFLCSPILCFHFRRDGKLFLPFLWRPPSWRGGRRLRPNHPQRFHCCYKSLTFFNWSLSESPMLKDQRIGIFHLLFQNEKFVECLCEICRMHWRREYNSSHIADTLSAQLCMRNQVTWTNPRFYNVCEVLYNSSPRNLSVIESYPVFIALTHSLWSDRNALGIVLALHLVNNLFAVCGWIDKTSKCSFVFALPFLWRPWTCCGSAE